MTVRLAPILILCSTVLPFVGGCGKKGPPLSPLRPVPAAISDLTASRLGETVQLQFTVPAANADGSRPADLAHIDVYAVTGTPEGPLGRPLTIREIETLATRVASLEIQPPPPPADEDEEPDEEGVPLVMAPAVNDTRPVQGAAIRVEEVLTDAARSSVFAHPDAAKFVARARDDVDPSPVPSTEGTGRPLLWPQPEREVARTYLVVPYSAHGRAGAPSAGLAVPFVPAPPAPPAPVVTHTESAFELAWTNPPGVQLPMQRTVTDEMQKSEAQWLPARPLVTYGIAHTYRVYQLPAPDAPAAAATGPLNQAPLETPAFTDPRLEFEVPRCYAVRTVERRGAITLESPLSPVTCLTARDTFPPPAPTGLTAVGSEGGVSLIWEPVTAPDLGGYLVLRGVEGEALKPLTSAPLTETTYRDTTTQAGVVYIYAVVAVDKASPANVSVESNRVRESAR